MLREIERIHLQNCYNIPDYTSMEYNISDITSKHAEENPLTFHSPLPWFQRFKINLWLKAAIDSSSRANQFEVGSDPDSVS